MEKLPEIDDEVDIIVSDEGSTPDSLREAVEFIKEYKSRPEYAEESKEARAILDALRINSKDYGIDDPAVLLDHWRACVADLAREEKDGHSNGKPI